MIVKKRGNIFMSTNFKINDIIEGLRLANDIRTSDQLKYEGVFLYTTENQEGINDIISYEGKDVVTVAASGDQYLGAVYYGAKKIDLFDINRISYYMACLKIASVRVLDYEEFIMFFHPLLEGNRINKNFWNLKTLRRLLPYMPPFVGLFWDTVMYEARKNDFGRLCAPLQERHLFYNIVSGLPFYKTKNGYYKLQALLRKRDYPDFYESDILDLGKNLVSSYDIVYLSNIFGSNLAEKLEGMGIFNNIFTNKIIANSLQKRTLRKVFASVDPHVNEGGIVLLNYRRNSSVDLEKDWLTNNDLIELAEVDSKYPPGSYWDTETDIVYTYRPRKKQ